MTTYQSLLSRVRQVRRKWRLQALLRGVSLLLACTIALLILGVWGADLFGFKPSAVWAMRVLIGAASVYVAYRFFLSPLLRRVSDVQVAQYIEERYPQLQDRLVTAVELGEQSKPDGGMLEMLVRDALEQTRRVDFSVFVDRRRVTVYGLAGGGSLLALLALLNWGPSFFPYGFDRLYMPWAEASSHSRSMIMVTPGNTDMAKGRRPADQGPAGGIRLAGRQAVYQERERELGIVRHGARTPRQRLHVPADRCAETPRTTTSRRTASGRRNSRSTSSTCPGWRSSPSPTTFRPTREWRRRRWRGRGTSRR